MLVHTALWYVLLLAFGYAMSWLMAVIAMTGIGRSVCGTGMYSPLETIRVGSGAPCVKAPTGQLIDGRRRHQLRRRGLVAPHQQHHAVDGVAADRFLDVHAREVAKEHGGRAQVGLAQRHHRELEREAAGLVDAVADRGDLGVRRGQLGLHGLAALHPEGLGGRVLNLPEWGRHITESLRSRMARGWPSWPRLTRPHSPLCNRGSHFCFCSSVPHV